MASSSGKPTAVHFTLIFFVMASVILGVVAFLMHRSYAELNAKYVKAQQDATQSQNALRTNEEEFEALRNALGHPGFEKIGTNPDEANTLLWAVYKDIRDYAGFTPSTPVAQLPSAHQALLNLRAELDRLQSDLNQTVATMKDLQAELQAERTKFNNTVAQYKQASANAEKDLRDYQANVEETLKARDNRIDELNREVAQLNDELQQKIDELAAVTAQKNEEIANLTLINKQLNKKLENIEQVSFEVADGQVVSVDYTNRIAYINLGEVDNLSKGTTFSVYQRAHHGIGRGQQDIIGALEVTNVIGPHLAEARIVDEDIYRPIGRGDPVYTPLWSPGRTEAFSLIGLIDIDGDGQYEGDRQILHEVIASAGARIDNEVDDEGNLHGDGITTHTKFLVVGEMPDPDSVPPESKEREIFLKIHRHMSGDPDDPADGLEGQARQRGVRIVSLNNFLAYIGYRPTRRLWRPGQNRPYVLKAGAHSTAVDEVIRGRESSGQVSGFYTRSKRLKQPTSTGQTSKVFGGRGYGSTGR